MRFLLSVSTVLTPFFKRFIAGTELCEAIEVVEKLTKKGFRATLDHLSPETRTETESLNATEHYVVMLRALKERGLERNVSLKLSRIGLHVGKAFCYSNLEKVVKRADIVGGFLSVDAENAFNADDAIGMVKDLKTSRRMPIGIVLQAAHKRTADDIVNLLNKEVTIRLCKGFCKKDGESTAFQDNKAIDREFIADAKRLLTSNSYHAIATHDEKIMDELKSFAKKHGIDKRGFEFQMFMGIRPFLQKKLLKEGFNVRIYVPFGRSWLPYIMRRMREDRDGSWLFVKNIFRR